MSDQGPIRTTAAELTDDDRAIPGRGQDATGRGQDGTESELQRFGLGPDDQEPGEDDAAELLAGADATQERESSLNQFGLGPEE